MRSPRLFLEHELKAASEIDLRDETFHYARNVLRLGKGAELLVFNGDGREFSARIQAVEKRGIRLLITAQLASVPQRRLTAHLGIGLSRGERMDWAVQKATELGVDTITPLALERCNIKLDAERGDVRLRHWRQIAISASEQCGRRDIPRISPMEALSAWLARRGDSLGLVLHTRQSRSLPVDSKPESASLMIGPEGGLTEAEFGLALAAGFHPWSLGPRVLRSETAPVAALAVLQFLWGDLRWSADQPAID